MEKIQEKIGEFKEWYGERSILGRRLEKVPFIDGETYFDQEVKERYDPDAFAGTWFYQRHIAKGCSEMNKCYLWKLRLTKKWESETEGDEFFAVYDLEQENAGPECKPWEKSFHRLGHVYFNETIWTLSDTRSPTDDPGLLPRYLRTSFYQFKKDAPNSLFLESHVRDGCYAEFKQFPEETARLQKPPRTKQEDWFILDDIPSVRWLKEKLGLKVTYRHFEPDKWIGGGHQAPRDNSRINRVGAGLPSIWTSLGVRNPFEDPTTTK
jgi:hypothetical protein